MVTTIVIIAAVLALIIWGSTRKSRMGHWMRVAVMFLSGGFVFPHALTEDDDVAQNDADKGTKAKAE
jgi:hypothetical protein